jgi:8-oxo-dGTP diphosphatase
MQDSGEFLKDCMNCNECIPDNSHLPVSEEDAKWCKKFKNRDKCIYWNKDTDAKCPWCMKHLSKKDCEIWDINATTPCPHCAKVHCSLRKQVKRSSKEYQNPSVTVDIVIFTIQDGDLRILLIKRKNSPFKGKWAIPGGFVEYDEPLEDAAKRELEEETGVRDVYIEQLYTFGEPRRDPRARVITVAYFALVSSEKIVLRPQTDASDVRWFSMYNLPKLAFDHDQILDCALSRLRNKILSSSAAFQFLQEKFTLTELQSTYESVLGKKIDKRNFRKKILSSNLLEETDEKKIEGRHRPARLYRFSPDTGKDLFGT